MQIRRESEVNAVPVSMEGAEGVTMKILIGTEDGSQNIIMRLFTVSPGGHTPHHAHNYEHLVRVQSGRGVAVDGHGNRHEIATGLCVFVPPNEEHQFDNPFPEPLVFTCTIPSPKSCAA